MWVQSIRINYKYYNFTEIKKDGRKVLYYTYRKSVLFAGEWKCISRDSMESQT